MSIVIISDISFRTSKYVYGLEGAEKASVDCLNAKFEVKRVRVNCEDENHLRAHFHRDLNIRMSEYSDYAEHKVLIVGCEMTDNDDKTFMYLQELIQACENVGTPVVLNWYDERFFAIIRKFVDLTRFDAIIRRDYVDIAI